MKSKNIDKFICITVAVVVFVFIIVPLFMAWYSSYIDYDPAWAMGLAFLVYIIGGPIMNGIIGVMYALKNKKPIIVLSIMLISNLLLGFTVLSAISLPIIFGPMIMFCLTYGIGYFVRSKSK